MNELAYRKRASAWMIAARAALSVSRREVSEAIGVSCATVGKWERSESTMLAPSHLRLKEFFKQRRKDAGKKPGVSG